MATVLTSKRFPRDALQRGTCTTQSGFLAPSLQLSAPANANLCNHRFDTSSNIEEERTGFGLPFVLSFTLVQTGQKMLAKGLCSLTSPKRKERHMPQGTDE